MKKNLLTFFIACCTLHSASAQNPLVKQWDYRYGGTSVEFFYDFHRTMDGNYILGGASASPISGEKTQDTIGNLDYWIVKVDTAGNKLWDKDFGGTLEDMLTSIQPTSDGGYILGGSSYSPAGGDKSQPAWNSNHDYWILKTDSMGNKQWDKDFGGDSTDFLYSILQAPDGGYLLGGTSASGISGDKTQPLFGNLDYWIVKTDSLGNKQWDKDFGGTGSDWLLSMQNTDDGGYILAGSSYSGIGGNKSLPNRDSTNTTTDYWMIKIDSSGNKLWEKVLGGTKSDHLSIIQKTVDGGYIVSGYSYSGISGDKTQDTVGSSDFWVVKTDSLCNKQWDKTFGGPGMEYETRSVIETIDGGYFITGTSHSNAGGDKSENNLGSSQIWLIKTDFQGHKEWDKTILTLGIGGRGTSIQNADGCYVSASMQDGNIGGDKTQNSWGSWDYWIIKFCDTTSTTFIPVPELQSSIFNVFPNPASSSFTVSFSSYEKQIVELRIYSTLGELNLFQSFRILEKGVSKEINVEKWKDGIYFFQLKTKDGTINRKLIINH